jgi:hypothetical protein
MKRRLERSLVLLPSRGKYNVFEDRIETWQSNGSGAHPTENSPLSNEITKCGKNNIKKRKTIPPPLLSNARYLQHPDAAIERQISSHREVRTQR